MLKKELTTHSQEILISDARNVPYFLDAFSYAAPEHTHYGNIFVLSRTITDDPALSYVSNLISSFIKREYYTHHNPRVPLQENFERALKKANEVVYDLVENHNIKLDIGIMLVGKDSAYVSKIGNIKLFLNRTGKIIDIFNDILHFERSRFADKEFSSLISGKVLHGDSLLFFLPNRRVSARETSIKKVFLSVNQKKFTAYLHELAQQLNVQKELGKATLANTKNSVKTPFYFCGFHINVAEKIINQGQETTVLASDKSAQQLPSTALNSQRRLRPSLFMKEVARLKKIGTFAQMGQKLNIVRKRLDSRMLALILVVAALVGASSFWGLRAISKRNAVRERLRNEVGQVEENIKLAESNFLRGEQYTARNLIEEGLTTLSHIKNENLIKNAQTNALALLHKIDKISDSKPEIFAQFESEVIIDRLVFAGNKLYAYESSTQKLFSPSTPLQSTTVPIEGKLSQVISYGDGILALNKSGGFLAIDVSKGAIVRGTLEISEHPIGIDWYQENLYLLTNTQIIKIADLLKDSLPPHSWLKEDNTTNDFISFDVGQSIFILTSESLKRYFKGRLIDEIPLEFPVASGARLFLLKNGFVVFDKERAKIRLIDTIGRLQVSFDVSSYDSISDIAIDKEAKRIYFSDKKSVYYFSF